MINCSPIAGVDGKAEYQRENIFFKNTLQVLIFFGILNATYRMRPFLIVLIFDQKKTIKKKTASTSLMGRCDGRKRHKEERKGKTDLGERD